MSETIEPGSLNLGADGVVLGWLILASIVFGPWLSQHCSSPPMSISSITLQTKSSTASSSSSKAELPRSVLDPQNFQAFPLVSRTVLSHNVTVFRFGLPKSSDSLGLPAGQHIALAFKDAESGKDISRSYTPISTDQDLGYFDVLVKLYPQGKMSTYLRSMKIGDTIRVRGPKGAMLYHSGLCQRIGMIAGGSGITPMMQVLKAAHAARPEHGGNDTTEIDLIYANQTYQDIIMKDELDEMARQDPRLRVHYVLSRPSEEWQGDVGHVDSTMIKDKFPSADAAGTKVMLCGPPGMMAAMKSATESLGYDKASVVSKRTDQVFCF